MVGVLVQQSRFVQPLLNFAVMKRGLIVSRVSTLMDRGRILKNQRAARRNPSNVPSAGRR